MSSKFAVFLTVIALICLQAFFPILIDHWVVTIAKALPSFFTLGVSTVLLYKAFRYPRGTLFTVFGCIQIALVAWLIWFLFKVDWAWISLPLLLAAIVFGPKSARASWKWFGVDKYYQHNSNS